MGVKFIGKFVLRGMDEQDALLALKIAADLFSGHFKDSNAVMVSNWLSQFLSKREAGEVAPLRLSARVAAMGCDSEHWPDFLNLSLALGAADLILFDGKWQVPLDVTIIAPLPLSARLRFIDRAYDRETMIEH